MAINAAAPQSGASGWLLHVDCRNVVTTHLAPLYQADKVIGYRVRLLEIAGRSVGTHVGGVSLCLTRKNRRFSRTKSPRLCDNGGECEIQNRCA